MVYHPKENTLMGIWEHSVKNILTLQAGSLCTFLQHLSVPMDFILSSQLNICVTVLEQNLLSTASLCNQWQFKYWLEGLT